MEQINLPILTSEEISAMRVEYERCSPELRIATGCFSSAIESAAVRKCLEIMAHNEMKKNEEGMRGNNLQNS